MKYRLLLRSEKKKEVAVAIAVEKAPQSVLVYFHRTTRSVNKPLEALNQEDLAETLPGKLRWGRVQTWPEEDREGLWKYEAMRAGERQPDLEPSTISR